MILHPDPSQMLSPQYIFDWPTEWQHPSWKPSKSRCCQSTVPNHKASHAALCSMTLLFLRHHWSLIISIRLVCNTVMPLELEEMVPDGSAKAVYLSDIRCFIDKVVALFNTLDMISISASCAFVSRPTWVEFRYLHCRRVDLLCPNAHIITSRIFPEVMACAGMK